MQRASDHDLWRFGGTSGLRSFADMNNLASIHIIGGAALDFKRRTSRRSL